MSLPVRPLGEWRLYWKCWEMHFNMTGTNSCLAHWRVTRGQGDGSRCQRNLFREFVAFQQTRHSSKRKPNTHHGLAHRPCTAPESLSPPHLPSLPASFHSGRMPPCMVLCFITTAMFLPFCLLVFFSLSLCSTSRGKGGGGGVVSLNTSKSSHIFCLCV